LYLVAPRRAADLALGIVAILSVIGIALIATWEIDPTRLRATQDQFVPLKIYPFFPIQLLLIALNIFGTIAFVGGALWSALHFARLRAQGERLLATVLIAIGGGIAAGAHSLGVLSGIELFRVSEFVAVLFIFAGFMLSNSPAKQTTPTPRAAG
jgi:predicted membrane protein